MGFAHEGIAEHTYPDLRHVACGTGICHGGESGFFTHRQPLLILVVFFGSKGSVEGLLGG
jgi:hypothetical protein